MNISQPFDDLIQIENSIICLTKKIDISVYDFDFRFYFNCNSVFFNHNQVVARIGAIKNYDQLFNELNEINLTLVNSPKEHLNASLISNWYPILKNWTPKSIIFETIPSSKIIENDFSWPVFLKGERQTSKHNKSLSIANNAFEFDEIIKKWKVDPILSWQKLVCREFVNLKPLQNENVSLTINPSYEVRVFVWKNNIVGLGNYWLNIDYQISKEDYQTITILVNQISLKLNVPFLVIDLGQKIDGKWILIEVNDAQESGYAGILPLTIWQNIIELEKNN